MAWSFRASSATRPSGAGETYQRTESPGSPKIACDNGACMGSAPWAAIDKATGCWIGKIGLDELDDWPDVDKIEVGFELHQAWWGRGLATEGALAALSFGFERHDLKRIISVTAASHAAARRVMEKTGLTYRGTRYWLNPEVPVVWYALDRTVWRATRS